MPPFNNEAPGDKAAGRSRFSSLFYVAAIGGKSPRTRQGVGLQLCTAASPVCRDAGGANANGPRRESRRGPSDHDLDGCPTPLALSARPVKSEEIAAHT